jgi:hypothetical protein
MYSSRDSGSIDINTIDSRFRIVGTKNYPEAGEVVDKMGRTTGWTWGDVTVTCRNRDVDDDRITYLCQSYANGGATYGDSGAPVFGLTGVGNNVILYGILWGGGAGLGDYVFSAYRAIQEDFMLNLQPVLP